MSKLKIVREALRENPDVVIAFSLGGDGGIFDGEVFSRTAAYYAYFLVTPKTGIYSADGLQAFMMGLVPGLKPDVVRPFEQGSRNLYCGRTEFSEEVGSLTATASITDDDLRCDYNPLYRHSAYRRDINRKTIVYVFPDEKIAKERSGVIPPNHILEGFAERYREKCLAALK